MPFDPGYISKQVVYGTNGTQPGWAWLPYYYKETWWGKPGEPQQALGYPTVSHVHWQHSIGLPQLGHGQQQQREPKYVVE